MLGFGTSLMGFGLSWVAGLSAYVALFALGMAQHKGLAHLNGDFAVLGSNEVLWLLGILAGIEFFADKIPMVDHLHDLLSTILRPAAGALLMRATNSGSGLDPTFVTAFGLLSAGSIHGAKATTRIATSGLTLGLGNPIISLIEDFLAVSAAVLAVLIPILVIIALPTCVVVGVVLARRYARRRREQAAVNPYVMAGQAMPSTGGTWQTGPFIYPGAATGKRGRPTTGYTPPPAAQVHTPQPTQPSQTRPSGKW